ncbi:hypothetical protein [Rhodopirellula sp. MGV]|uniref:hypothetical protein n=1 Tax=Rhodopirellula sp. MGV TaxID=2023130 RepID=UPI000B964812|nr:hypothetical protein [Rhodopirellula sp. MGV]OYP36838.1 hypothetical protein CGZ80_07260 [Rhodopirellula sp. MGV]PNY36455.1 hypothetical protein C2E31_12720 [Rhodopirellula baltica]
MPNKPSKHRTRVFSFNAHGTSDKLKLRRLVRFLKKNKVDVGFIQEASKNSKLFMAILRDEFPNGEIVIKPENANQKLRTFNLRSGPKVIQPATGREQAYAYVITDKTKTTFQHVGMPDYINHPGVAKNFFKQTVMEDDEGNEPEEQPESRYPRRQRETPMDVAALNLAGERRPEGVIVNNIQMYNFHAPQGGGSGGKGTSGMMARTGNAMFAEFTFGKPFVLNADTNLTHSAAQNVYKGAKVISSNNKKELLSHTIVSGFKAEGVKNIVEPELLDGLSDHPGGVMTDIE